MFRRALESSRFTKPLRWVPSFQHEQARSSCSTISSVRLHKTTTPSVVLVALAGFFFVSSESKITYNHCQVPCGIFDDPALVGELRQACTTIRKAIRSCKELHQSIGSDLISMNQIVRWINTKEEHCNKIISLVSEYCLCQRVKRINFKSDAEYLEVLKVHHTAMQAAMKAKQSMDESDCIALEHAVENLAKMYTV